MRSNCNLSVMVLIVLTHCFMSGSAKAASTAERLSQLVVPFDAKVLSVGSNMEHNGQIVSMATFKSPSSLNDTVAFYRELWSQEQTNGMPGMVENRAGQWLIMGQLQNGFQNVLQLNMEDPHRSEGFLSVMQLQAGSQSPLSDTVLPGMERLSTTRSVDAGRGSEISVYLSPEPIEPLARQLSGFWQSKGWTLVSDEPYAQSRVLLLNRKRAQLEIVVSHSSGEGTLVVMNEVDDHD